MTEQPLQKGLLDAVVTQMTVGVVVVEAPSGRVLAANDAASKILRRATLEWEGFHTDGRPYLLHEWPLARALAAGDVIEHQDISILRGDGTLGIISVSAAPIRDGDRIVAAVTTFVDVTHTRREEAALALLSDASVLGGDSLVYEETIRRIARLAVPSFADLAFIHLSDGGEKITRHEAAAADPAKKALIDEAWRRDPPTNETLRRIIEKGEPELFATIPRELVESSFRDEVDRNVFDKLGIRSVINAPMRASGRVFGVMTFARTREHQPYDAFDVMVAEELARRAAAAIEKSRLFESERAQRIRAERAAERIGHLQALSSALATALTVDAVSSRVTDVLTRVVNARGIVLALCLSDEEIEISHAAGFPPEIIEQFRRMPRTANLPLVRAINERRPIWMRNPRERTMEAPVLESLPSANRAWAALPIESHGRALGAIGFSFGEEREFDEEERNLLLGIAGQCAMAIERASLFESERRAREEAERASRAKDEFLAILSHELRTPMTTVIGWADFLKMTHGHDPELTGPLDALRNSAKMQAKLVDDLLDVSRIIAGKLAMRSIDAELTSIVRNAVNDLLMQARGKGVEIETHVEAERVPVYGDPDRLRQLVTNLLVNAVKFTPSGGRVTVSVSEQDGHAEIVVADTGEGIDPDFLPHVFDRFRQASVGDSRRHSGLGLGLSIVQHIAQRHGGSVRAESEGLGHGARFIVRLPKRRD